MIFYSKLILKFILFTANIFLCSLAYSQTETHIRSVPLFEKNGIRINRCLEIFKIASYQVQMVVSEPLRINSANTLAEVKPVNQRSSYVDEWLDKTLNEWLRSGHYTAEQIEYLRNKEMNLAPERTSYHSVEYADRLTGIRVFDGSTVPLISSLSWLNIHAKNPQTPIEKQYSYRFPERDLKESAYIWELGLLSSPDFFLEGVSSNFVQMARLLDQNYNMNNMGAFSSTSQVDLLNFAIYGIARRKLVPHYEALGFKVVVDSKSGEPMIFKDDMHLIRMSGATLLNNFFWGRPTPETQGYSYTLSTDRKKRALLNAERIDQRRHYVQTPEQAQYNLQLVYDHLVKLKVIHDNERIEMELYEAERSAQGGSPRQVHYRGREESTQKALDELYVIWHSLPEGFIDYQTWFYMRGSINFLFSANNPAKAVEMAIAELSQIPFIKR